MKLLGTNSIPNIESWNIEMMLNITSRLVEASGPEGSSNKKIRACREFIEKCRSQTVKSKDVVVRMMNVIPTYGSAIGAGYALVLLVSPPSLERA